MSCQERYTSICKVAQLAEKNFAFHELFKLFQNTEKYYYYKNLQLISGRAWTFPRLGYFIGG